MSSPLTPNDTTVETQILYTHISDLTKKNVQLEIEITKLKNLDPTIISHPCLEILGENISALTKDLNISNEKIGIYCNN